MLSQIPKNAGCPTLPAFFAGGWAFRADHNLQECTSNHPSPRQCHPERGLIFAHRSAKINRSRRIPRSLPRLQRQGRQGIHDASGLCTALGPLI
jgi:hypothetical protein